MLLLYNKKFFVTN